MLRTVIKTLATVSAIAALSAGAVATATAAPASGDHDNWTPAKAVTIYDYITNNGIVQTPLNASSPGGPAIAFEVPAGWSLDDSAEAEGLYSLATNDSTTTAGEPPSIAMVVAAQLEGDVDGAQLLSYASGEAASDPTFEPISEFSGTTSGYDSHGLKGTIQDPDVGLLYVTQHTVFVEEGSEMFVVQLLTLTQESSYDSLAEDIMIINSTLSISPR